MTMKLMVLSKVTSWPVAVDTLKPDVDTLETVPDAPLQPVQTVRSIPRGRGLPTGGPCCSGRAAGGKSKHHTHQRSGNDPATSCSREQASCA